MSNSKQMSLEDRLVQQIKDTQLGALVGDEDAILKLVERCVYEATVQPRRIPSGYGGFEEKDSPAVAAAREVAKKAAEQIAEKLVADLFADQAHVELIRGYMISAMPEAILTAVAARFRDLMQGNLHNYSNLQLLARHLNVSLMEQPR